MQSTGVILSVTPRVNKNGLVQLDISQEVSNSVPTTTSGIDSPTIQQRKLSTTVEVKNGDTIALGGLITDSKSSSKSGVPICPRFPYWEVFSETPTIAPPATNSSCSSHRA